MITVSRQVALVPHKQREIAESLRERDSEDLTQLQLMKEGRTGDFCSIFPTNGSLLDKSLNNIDLND